MTSADVTATFDTPSSAMQLSIVIDTADGPFNLVLLVDSLTIQILDAST